MALARTLALLLAAAAAPALAQPAPAAKPPAAAAPVVTNAPPSPQKADDWPKGAPQTDYEFTAWCYGVLRTHMELYDKVKPELTAISKRWKTEEEDEKSYSDQLAAGKVLLAQFARAIELTEKASPRAINAQGAAAITQGRAMWKDFDGADKSTQAYSWMNWELPEKCPKVATALENRSLLASPALKSNAATPKTEPKPAPASTAAATAPIPYAAAAKPAEKTVAAATPPKPADPIGQLVADTAKKESAPAAKPAETKTAETKTAETKPAPPPPAPVKLRPGRY